METRIEAAAGVYVHFPFCKRCCFYCHFVKYPYDKDLARRYVQALVREIGLKTRSGVTVDTIYLGGGSPSLLESRQLEEIIEAIGRKYTLSKSLEITLEANPEDIDPQKLKEFVACGVNRLSLGVQSFIPGDLKYLKRNHTTEQALAAVEHARAAGLTNLNLDFIMSLPSQTQSSLEENFSMVAKLDVPHISAYILEGVLAGEKKDRRDHQFYYFTREFLGCMGYDHYEVSNFSRGKESASRHNLKYWENTDYVGLGLGASGFEDGLDYKNTASFEDYFSMVVGLKLPIEESIAPDVKVRRIVMGLRLLEGISLSAFRDFPEPLKLLEENGVLRIHRGKVAVVPEKILLLNEILTYFL